MKLKARLEHKELRSCLGSTVECLEISSSFPARPSLPLGGSKQEGITQSWAFGCREAATGCQEWAQGLLTRQP